MKNKFIKIAIAIASLFLHSCANQSKQNQSSISNNILNQSNDSILIIKNLLVEAYNKNNYFGYFKYFPNTYQDFMKLFGFDDSLGGMPLYDNSNVYINFFFQSYDLNKNLFIPKLFNLTKNGYWDADAPFYLKENIYIFFNHHSKEFVEYLNTRPQKDIEGFWHFTFDGPLPKDQGVQKIFKKIYNKVNSYNKTQGKILKNVYDKME